MGRSRAEFLVSVTPPINPFLIHCVLTHVKEAMYAASKAYRGWGFSDYWYDRYVYLTCTDYSRQKDCSSGKVVAFYSSTHDKKYPLVTFCSPFFDRPDR